MKVSNVLRGADLKLYINNRPFGKAVSVSWTIDEGTYSIMELDSLLPFEIADGPIRVSGSIEVIPIRKDGGLEGQGITALPHQHELSKYITIHIVDRRTDAIVFQTDKVRVKSQSWQVRPKALVQCSFTFEGIGYTNDSAS